MRGNDVSMDVYKCLFNMETTVHFHLIDHGGNIERPYVESLENDIRHEHL